MKYLFMGLLSAVMLIVGGALITETWIGWICLVGGGLLIIHIAAAAVADTVNNKLNKD